MNISKIYQALKDDEMNSSLGIIIHEIESQGYKVRVNGKEITSNEIFEDLHPDLESLQRINIAVYSESSDEHIYSLQFLEYHQVSITDPGNYIEPN
jgi:hypothetical protein